MEAHAVRVAWGARLSPSFLKATVFTCRRVGIADPSLLTACMGFETGRTFRPDIRNAAGSGAVGLIQFMPQTCAGYGLSVEEMAAMTPEHQLMYVELYFKHWTNKLKNLGDVYGAILWPAMVGKTDDYVVFDKADVKHPKRYLQNKGLDVNKDGKVTRGEAVAKVQACLTEGLLPQNSLIYEGP